MSSYPFIVSKIFTHMDGMLGSVKQELISSKIPSIGGALL
jgi:hypothetical protein